MAKPVRGRKHVWDLTKSRQEGVKIQKAVVNKRLRVWENEVGIKFVLKVAPSRERRMEFSSL